jgi:hypothetical protein
MRLLLCSYLLFLLCAPAWSGEWTGFRDATLGADISQLGGFRQARGDLFARVSDVDAVASFGLSAVLYEVSGAKIVAVLFFAKDEEAATALRGRLSKSYGAPIQMNEQLTAWTGEQTQIVGLVKGGVIGFKLQRRPLEPPTPVPDAEASNDNGLGEWMEDEARKDAEKARIQAEAEARAEAEALAARQHQAEIDAQTEEITNRVIAAQQKQLAEEAAKTRACGVGAHWKPMGGSVVWCVDVGGTSVPNYCCARQ